MRRAYFGGIHGAANRAEGEHMMKLLTVVIPSYNSESFIEKNVATFLDERLYEKAEVLIINDGSTDKTAELAKRLEDGHRGYIRLIDKENGGHGSGINRGIREAAGKYFKVVDADDWVETEGLVRLAGELDGADADVVVNPYFTIDQATGRKRLVELRALRGIGPECPFDDVMRRNAFLSLPAVTYRTAVLRDNGITVTEKCFYEDWQYGLYPAPYLRTARILEHPVYCYLVGQQSQSVSNESVLKNKDMYFKVLEDMISYYKANRQKCTPLADCYMKNSICTFARSMYNIFLRNYKSEAAMETMLEMDRGLKGVSQTFYDLVGRQNRYIKCLRAGNKAVFSCMGRLMGMYKKL